jgi:ferredoxin--NADP+ reductase
LIEDRANWWQPAAPAEEAIVETLRERGVDFMDWKRWLNVDANERALGEGDGRERIKLFDRSEMLRVSKGS